MPRRLLERDFWNPLVAMLGVMLTLGMGVLAFSVYGYVRQSQDSSNRNRQLICLLDRLFGLDRPLSAAQRHHLRPIQAAALREIIESCPGLGRPIPERSR